MRTVLVGVVAAAVVCGGASADKESAKKSLMDADRAFAKATAERRIDGWMEFFADDAVRITPLGGKATVGREAIRELDGKMLADPSVKLVWEPTDAGAFSYGKHGFTTGKGTIFRTKDGGEQERLADVVYITMWRKDGDKWKIILDTGARAEKRDEE